MVDMICGVSKNVLATCSPSFAVFGNPVAHSLSPQIHHLFAAQCGIDIRYEKKRIEPSVFVSEVDAFFQTGGQGLNITAPFKEKAFEIAQVRTPRCARARAANTLWRVAGKLYADNTDGIGLLRDLTRYVDLADKTILIIGAGGVVRAILGALLAAKPAKIILTNRTLEKAQRLSQEFSVESVVLADLSEKVDLIIHASSAHFSDKEINLPQNLLEHQPFCYDLTYNPHGRTPFLEWVFSRQGKGVDGLGMLIEQAAESFSIWHGIKPNTFVHATRACGQFASLSPNSLIFQAPQRGIHEVCEQRITENQ